MKRNGNRRINQYVFLCRIVLFLAISGLIVTIQAVHEAEAKGEKENMVPNTNTQSPGLPLIDKVVPSLFETATFGLG